MQPVFNVQLRKCCMCLARSWHLEPDAKYASPCILYLRKKPQMTSPGRPLRLPLVCLHQVEKLAVVQLHLCREVVCRWRLRSRINGKHRDSRVHGKTTLRQIDRSGAESFAPTQLTALIFHN